MALAEHGDAAGDHERADQGEDGRQHAPLLGLGVGDAEAGGQHDGAQHDDGDRVHEKRQHAGAHSDDTEPDQDIDRQRAGFAGGVPQQPVMLFLGDLAVLQQAGEVEHDFHDRPAPRSSANTVAAACISA
jgi:hypothetical protein